jgi:serine/threonine protein kinase
MRDY